MPQLCSGAVGVILVFNSNNPISLEEAEEWLNLISKYAHPNFHQAVVLVANKSDKPATIPESDVTSFCDKHNVAQYIQCSAKTGENVSSVFESICTAIQLNSPELITTIPLLHTESY
jgi:signal recognition particle receptor subunit beta